jgi:PAS domain S-box-containing protein
VSYTKSLVNTLVTLSHNKLFYQGNLTDGSKILTKEVVQSVHANRCSIWLYNHDKTSIICEQLYIKEDDAWYQGSELFKSDYQPYFDALDQNPIIIADNAETHMATACFLETYLKIYNIKSLLDVPIMYMNEVIGVVCVESLTQHKWSQIEVDFIRLIAAMYAFSYSVSETLLVSNSLNEMERFIDKASLISKTDAKGRITYVNKRFEDVSGFKLNDVIGKDHSIVNSGQHSKKFWRDMYKTALSGEIWNSVVTNKRKDGSIYYVDSYIKADFDPETKQLIGYTSIRQDVTEIVESTNEINKKNTYLEHAAKILRHDMHSGINTYIPRGISSLERRLSAEVIEQYKLEAPLKMLKEGLLHAQKVYKGVYEFTNLVKKDVVLGTTLVDLKQILENYLATTAYKSQVKIDTLVSVEVNESLFCTAIDNLIRNGLRYNDSNSKFVHIYIEGPNLIIQDNGRGMTQQDLQEWSKPYTRKENQKESGSGLGLNICIAILNEHKFTTSCEKNNIGTKFKIKVIND